MILCFNGACFGVLYFLGVLQVFYVYQGIQIPAISNRPKTLGWPSHPEIGSCLVSKV